MEEVKLGSLINILTTKTKVKVISSIDKALFEGPVHRFINTSIYETVYSQEVFRTNFKKGGVEIYLH